MASSLVKELYRSSNGDRWVLRKGESGLVVAHFPNEASGGLPSETSVESFLSAGPFGPEHQALLKTLGSPPTLNRGLERSLDDPQELSRALGQAVAQCWSSLPQDIQQTLFEAAVTAEGEQVRQPLAIFLHGKHARTIETVQARAMPEPDSLGG
jgi:hypothetical protein